MVGVAHSATFPQLLAEMLSEVLTARPGTLVNNAGIFIAKPFTDYTQQDYDAATGINLTGFFRITQQQRRRPRRHQDPPCIPMSTISFLATLQLVGRMGEILHIDGGVSAGH